MKQIKGPAIFLAQFVGNEAPFNTLEGLLGWASSLGYKAVQMPTLDAHIFDLEKAANDPDYVENVKVLLNKYGLEMSELSTHIQGQLVAVNPAYNELMDQFVPDAVKNNDEARQEWAVTQMKYAAKASKNFGLKSHATFSGSFLWPFMYPWPPRPAGLIEHGFEELARRWLPILNYFDEQGVDVCYELHPGEDLFDGATFERFLELVDHHPRANVLFDPSHLHLQNIDYIKFIDIYHDRIKAFHVKDAELNCNGRQGVYSGYESWENRTGRFRSLGDGQIDFNAIFSKLTQYGFNGWAVLEWECCLKSPEQGAREGVDFIKNCIIEPSKVNFENFAKTESGINFNNVLGIK